MSNDLDAIVFINDLSVDVLFCDYDADKSAADYRNAMLRELEGTPDGKPTYETAVTDIYGFVTCWMLSSEHRDLAESIYMSTDGEISESDFDELSIAGKYLGAVTDHLTEHLEMKSRGEWS